MKAQKQLHASQLWQQGLNDVILKSCDIIVLNTLPLVVQCKIFSLMNAQARNYQHENVCVFDRNLASYFWSVFSYIGTEYGDLRSKSPYLLLRTRNNSVFRRFSCSDIIIIQSVFQEWKTEYLTTECLHGRAQNANGTNCSHVFYKTTVLKNLAKIIGEHLQTEPYSL